MKEPLLQPSENKDIALEIQSSRSQQEETIPHEFEDTFLQIKNAIKQDISNDCRFYCKSYWLCFVICVVAVGGIGAGIGATVGSEVWHTRAASILGAGLGGIAGLVLGGCSWSAFSLSAARSDADQNLKALMSSNLLIYAGSRKALPVVLIDLIEEYVGEEDDSGRRLR